jgi:CheY-like chemotaxis protein
VTARILLVEDNEVNADMLSRRLERRGFVVYVATDGLQAVAMARSEAPDLILMDISLPEIDGHEATRRIRAHPATAAIPILTLTAHAMTSDRTDALSAGCAEFETKPVDFDRLLVKIRALLGQTV